MAIRNYNNPKGIYGKTPVKNFYLDLWVPIEIPSTDEDKIWVIEEKYDRRPDLAAYDLYGSPDYWYVFALRNKDILMDPIEDFTAGKVIIVPPKKVLS